MRGRPLLLTAALIAAVAAVSASPLYAAPKKGYAVPSVYNAPNMEDMLISCCSSVDDVPVVAA